MMIAEPLNLTERSALDQLEAEIRTGVDASIRIGKALKEIRERKLYKHYGTFDDYCLNRWNFTGERARQLINFIEVRNDVPVSSERQARELKSLNSEERKHVWDTVISNISTKSLWEDSNISEDEKEVWSANTPSPRPTLKQISETVRSGLTKEQFLIMQQKEKEALERRKKCIENGRKAKNVTPAQSAKKWVIKYIERIKKYHAKFPDVSVLLDDTIESYIQIIESSHVLNS